MSRASNNTWLSSLGGNSRLTWMAIAGGAVFLLFYLGGDRVWNYLPFGLLLLCPLMHIFMHRGGHGGHGDQGGHDGHGGHGCCAAPAQENQPRADNNEKSTHV